VISNETDSFDAIQNCICHFNARIQWARSAGFGIEDLLERRLAPTLHPSLRMIGFGCIASALSLGVAGEMLYAGDSFVRIVIPSIGTLWTSNESQSESADQRSVFPESFSDRMPKTWPRAE